jgi:hypothetical protein
MLPTDDDTKAKATRFNSTDRRTWTELQHLMQIWYERAFADLVARRDVSPIALTVAKPREQKEIHR